MPTPALFADRTSIKTGLFIQPWFNATSVLVNHKTKIFEQYKIYVYPTLASLEPDAGLRAQNQQVIDLMDATPPNLDNVDVEFGHEFFHSQLVNEMFINNTGDVGSSQNLLLFIPELWDLLVNGGAISTPLLEEIGQKFKNYIFSTTSNTSNINLTSTDAFVGDAFRDWLNSARFTASRWIDALDQYAIPHHNAIFGGSCPSDNAVPDQPNSPTIFSVSHDEVVVQIGESPCDHGLAIDHYKVSRRLSGVGNYVEIAQHTNLTDLKYTDATVMASTAYEYIIEAHNATGYSVLSTNIEAITLASPVDNEDPPDDLLDFLDDLVSGLGDFIGNILLAVSEISNDALFTAKMLEVIVSTQSDMSITNLDTLSTNQFEVAKKIKIIAQSETSL